MPESNLQAWAELFAMHRDALFLSNEEFSWTYGDLQDAFAECNEQFKAMAPGVCLVQGDYHLKSVAWVLAGLCQGWTVVPVVSDSQEHISSRERISGATHKACATSGWKLRAIDKGEDEVERITCDVKGGVVLFSSGSTGEPKAMLKAVNIELTASDIVKRSPMNMGLLLLFDHIGGLNTLISGMKRAAHLVAPLHRNPRIMAELIERHSVRVLPCSPTFLNMMHIDGIFEEFKFESLRLVTYGTERMPDSLLKKLSQSLPRTKFLQTFGTSETGIVKTKSLSSSSTFLTIDDPEVEWQVVDNELWVRTKDQIKSYINVHEEAISDGWFKTGDLVEMRDKSYFRIIGRKKDVINVGGEKVLPAEVEDILMRLDRVVDCTAFSVPNGITGQSVGVRVVPVADADLKALKQDIRRVARAELESFKVPVKIIFESDVRHTDRFKKAR